MPGISGVVLLSAPVSADLVPPTGTNLLKPAPNKDGWVNSNSVAATISASDSGSGLSQIRYWIDNAPASTSTASTATPIITGEGKHNVGARAIDNAGNVSSQMMSSVWIDVTAPSV